MRTILAFSLLIFSAVCTSSEIRSLEEAWSYLNATINTHQRVVIESKKNGRYVQCENMGSFLKCPFPVWAKVLPNVELTRQKAARGSPYPEVAGSKRYEYITPIEIAVLKNIIRENRLTPDDVYISLVDQKGKVVGSSYDIVVIIEPSYKYFTLFVQNILEKVWNSNASDGYTISIKS